MNWPEYIYGPDEWPDEMTDTPRLMVVSYKDARTRAERELGKINALWVDGKCVWRGDAAESHLIDATVGQYELGDEIEVSHRPGRWRVTRVEVPALQYGEKFIARYYGVPIVEREW